MPSQTTVLVISGLPGSGKSTLAEYLRRQLLWPLLAKDELKEVLFETLGIRDRDWSRRLSKAAYALMFRQAGELVRADCSCIIEGNFRHGEFESQLAQLAERARLVQAHCHAPPQVLVERFRNRTILRHAGHADVESLAEIENEMLRTLQRPLSIAGIVVDCENSAASTRWAEHAAGRVMANL